MQLRAHVAFYDWHQHREALEPMRRLLEAVQFLQKHECPKAYSDRQGRPGNYPERDRGHGGLDRMGPFSFTWLLSEALSAEAAEAEKTAQTSYEVRPFNDNGA